MATNSSKYKLTGVNGSEIQISLNGPTGPTGPANVLNIGSVTTAETGVPAAASITGSSPSQLLHLTLPKGNTGTAATIAVGNTTTAAAGNNASVTNSGTSSAAVFNFDIPRGNTGQTGTAATIAVGNTTTGAAGSSASVTNSGTSSAAVFNFDIPRGNTGQTGPATQLSVASTSTGSAGSDASVTISGTAPVQSLAFTIPRGNTGATGPATQLSVASTSTGAAGTNASVTISGTAPVQSLAFTIPQGIQGIQGETGSSGATALLTGYVSGAGTVAATDTVIQAVGKLNGNDELKAPIASLYPYIGGKLLTYLDEEAAIADPLISAGDIYRKTAGGVDYVNPDNVPSLDLRFATDKTLTARRGPTPTFTRGSGATYIGSDGLIHGIDTSTTSNSISAASKTFTLDATTGQDQFWRAGDAVEASNGSNSMVGTVTSYNAATQSLVCNMTTVSGSGTFTSWRIGYRGPRFDHDPVSRTNQWSASEDLGASPWQLINTTTLNSNNTTAPDGLTTADRFTVGGATQECGFFRNSFSFISGTTYTISCYLKADQVTRVSIYAVTQATLPIDAYFDLTGNGSVTANASGTASIQKLSNGWYRCVITGTALASLITSVRINAATTGNSRNYVGNSVDSFWAWGAQLETGAFATSYIPTTTAPVTIRDCKGLLIEEGGRTNLTTQSGNPASWTGGFTNDGATTAPDGSSNGVAALVGTSSITTPATGAITGLHAASVFVKRNNTDWARIQVAQGSFAHAVNFWVNLATGAAGTLSTAVGTPTSLSAQVTPFGNSWYRISITASYPATASLTLSVISATADASVTRVAGSIYEVWGAQLEAGAFPTSYIPTTTASAARAADVCTITSSAFNSFYNQSEGTFLSKTQLFSIGNDYNASYWNVFNPPNYMRVSVFGQTSTQESSYLQNDTPTTLSSTVASEQSRISRAAGAYQLNNARLVKNGTLGVLDTTFTPYSNLTSLTIMSQASGTINSLRYYRKRLPDAKLQALTV